MKTNNTTTTIISAYNLETLAQTNGVHDITVNTSKEFYALHDYLVFALGWSCYKYAHVSQDGNVTINIRVNDNQPENTPPTTMNANETIAPEFSELSHAATNIVLAAENTCNIYQNHVEPLLRSLERKAAKGVTLSLDTLAKSSAMAVIIRESIKEVKRTSYDPFSANTDDRRSASLYLAAIYICDL